jgi:hypothetical protein
MLPHTAGSIADGLISIAADKIDEATITGAERLRIPHLRTLFCIIVGILPEDCPRRHEL